MGSMKKIFFIIITFFLLGMSAYALEIQSPDFKEGQMIPRSFTCMGSNQSPSLSWQGEPEGTVSFALICEDPDAPVGVWTHWIVFNLPASIHSLAEGVSPDAALAGGAQQGLSDFQKTGYGGPCPPLGQKHRYEFKLYALDIILSLTGAVTRAQLLAAIEGHVLAEACLTGMFKR
jgi:Raf kinase inhibitor-like YbhB/YbcL family protein